MNLNAFPFFDSLQAMRSATRHGERLKSERTRFLPFQLRKTRDNQPIDCVNVYRENGTLHSTIMGNQLAYDYHQTLDTDFITYHGAALPNPLPCGVFYLEIGGRYSALFETVSSISELVKVEWSAKGNLSDTLGHVQVLYQTGFVQRLYLPTEVTLPAYPYEETGSENEYKEFFADFRRVTKQSQFTTLLLPVYLADALGALPLHDTVHVGVYRDVRQVEVSPEWLDYGTGASVTVKFSESAPVIAMGCDSPLELETIDTASYTPRGFLCGQPDERPYWEPTGVVSCEQGANGNTGYTLIEQRDMNTESPTYNQLRTVRGTLNTGMCAVTVLYYSTEQSAWVARNNCQPGYEGTEVLVKVAAGAYSSTVSQLDANNKALTQLNAIKQQTANSEGTCEPVAIYQYAGRVTIAHATSSQACFDTAYALNIYTPDGTFGTDGDRQPLYTSGVGGVLPNGYYKRNTDGKVMDVGGGMWNGIYSCGGDDNEEF